MYSRHDYDYDYDYDYDHDYDYNYNCDYDCGGNTKACQPLPASLARSFASPLAQLRTKQKEE